MPKLGTVTIDVWPRQNGASKNFYMDIVKSAMFDKQRVCVVVMNKYSEADIRTRIAEIIEVGGPPGCNPNNLAAYGIDLQFELPQPFKTFDILYVMQEGDNIDWNAIVNYARKRVDVRVVRIYDDEVNKYV